MTEQKSPRLVRRGEVVKAKGTDLEEVVRGVQIVLQLSNGANDSYSVDELVEMGSDNDISVVALAAAAAADVDYIGAKRVAEAAAAELLSSQANERVAAVEAAAKEEAAAQVTAAEADAAAHAAAEAVAVEAPVSE